MRCVPKINGVFWASLALSCVFGTNAGEVLSEVVGIGHGGGLVGLTAGLIVLFIADSHAKVSSALAFWAAVVLVGLAAGHVGIVLGGADPSSSAPVAGLLLGAMALAWRSVAPSTRRRGFIHITAVYWLTLFVAGVFGTMAGGAASGPLGLGNFGAMVAFGLPLLGLLFIGRKGLNADLAYHWLLVALTSSTGAAAGHLLANELRSAALGTALSGAAFVAVVVIAYAMTKDNSRWQPRHFGPATP